MDKKSIVLVMFMIVLGGAFWNDGKVLKAVPPVDSQVVVTSASYKVVTVKNGDSLWKIAITHCPHRNTRTVVDEMLKINKIGKYIYPGDKLKIPLDISRSKKPIKSASRGEFDREMTFEATAYTHTGNQTATMTWPEENRTIAVDPEVIPLNSRVYVSCDSWPQVNGEYVAEDTGGMIKGNIIDVFMDTEEQAILWGRRSVQVKVLE